MNTILEMSNKVKSDVIIIIDEGGSILSSLIYDELIHKLRKKDINALIIKTNKEDGDFLIKEHHINVFPTLLYYKNTQIKKIITGFSYNIYHNFKIV